MAANMASLGSHENKDACSNWRSLRVAPGASEYMSSEHAVDEVMSIVACWNLREAMVDSLAIKEGCSQIHEKALPRPYV